MNIAYYCQHVLGVGHFHRSLEICRKLADRHEVTMITGGAPLENTVDEIAFVQLPGLMMDSDFNNLAPLLKNSSLEEVKKRRAEKLWSFFETAKPDAFLVELYPFGRKSFRFELDPVLSGIKDRRLHSSLTICSLRDILVERHDREKFEARTIKTLNTFFDGLLIHGDERFIPLETTFGRMSDIVVPIAYTGYVTPAVAAGDRSRRRRELGIDDQTQLIVASIGGGNVGSELLLHLVKAFATLDDNTMALKIFTGPYSSPEMKTTLEELADSRTTIHRFSNRFTDWLTAADLSISMAGYNTTMNTLAAGTPALFYPFGKNQEQRMRIAKLSGMVPFGILGDEDLEPYQFASRIRTQLKQARFQSPLPLDGARRTTEIVEQWFLKSRR